MQLRVYNIFRCYTFSKSMDLLLNYHLFPDVGIVLIQKKKSFELLSRDFF